jgi:hypothetical protein
VLNDGHHPLNMFAGRCEAVVSFEAPEGWGGTPADITSAKVASANSALVITVSTSPPAPSLTSSGGAFTYVVTARSVAAQPVWIEVSDELLADVFEDDNPFGRGRLTTAKRVLFVPNQERRVFIVK